MPLALVAGGCRQAATPQSAAQLFVDRYYVERDHQAALALCTDAAAQRVRDEEKLLEGAGLPTGELPHVYSKLEGVVPGKDGDEATFTVTVDSGGVRFKKRVLLVVRKEAEQYKVAYFSDTDLPE